MKQSKKYQRTGKTGTLRIIGGHWRSRRISFAAESGIRPTPDAVRETLFNWLAPYIDGASCLDLFAGSGALGFEAASRAAAQVVMVENNRNDARQLGVNKDKLEADTVTVIQQTAEVFVRETGDRFDIVFIDPPFQQDIIESICNEIKKNNVLKPAALIYIETEKQLAPLPIPADWHIIRQRIQGAVAYYLVSTDV